MDILVVASGATEREALPELLRELRATTGRQSRVVHPPPGQKLTSRTAADLIIAHYWATYQQDAQPIEKAVVLVDADARSTELAESAVRDELERLVTNVTSRGLKFLVASAKWQLESWFFADPENLRDYLGRDLGSIDASQPDAIVRPKHHLMKLLGRPYTSRVSGEIARILDPQRIRERSLSFRRFEASVSNG